MKKNIPLLYGFSFFDQFMIAIAVWVPYLTSQGISMRPFMELQAVFALVILCGEVPSGLQITSAAKVSPAIAEAREPTNPPATPRAALDHDK